MQNSQYALLGVVFRDALHFLRICSTNLSRLLRLPRIHQTSSANQIACCALALGSSVEGIAKPTRIIRKDASSNVTKKLYHVADLWVIVVDHCVFKWLQKVLLELEMGQFFLFQKAHGELSERVQGEESNMRVIMTTYLRPNRKLTSMIRSANSLLD